MSTLKANKDKARFISNPISQDALDTDWVDHEVITKYKLPEIVLDASTTESLLVSQVVITTGDKLKVLDGANMVERTAGTVTTDVAPYSPSIAEVFYDASETITDGGTLSTAFGAVNSDFTMVGFFTVNDTDYTNLFAVDSNSFLKVASDGTDYYFGHYNGATESKVDNTTAKITGSEFFVCARVSGNEMLLQINTSKATFTKTVSFSAGTTTLVGRDGVNASQNMNGSSREVRIFDYAVSDAEIEEYRTNSTPKYQAPITGLTVAPTKAYFNKTIDTTLSAEATGKCLTSEREYITIDDSTASDGSNIVSTTELISGERIVVDGEDELGGTVTPIGVDVTIDVISAVPAGTAVTLFTNGNLANNFNMAMYMRTKMAAVANSGLYLTLDGSTGNANAVLVATAYIDPTGYVRIAVADSADGYKYLQTDAGTITNTTDFVDIFMLAKDGTLSGVVHQAGSEVARLTLDISTFTPRPAQTALQYLSGSYAGATVDYLSYSDATLISNIDVMVANIQATGEIQTILNSMDITAHGLGSAPTKAYRKGGEDLTFVSSTTSEYVGTNPRSGLITTGDVIQLDGATEVVCSDVVESVGVADITGIVDVGVGIENVLFALDNNADSTSKSGIDYSGIGGIYSTSSKYGTHSLYKSKTVSNQILSQNIAHDGNFAVLFWFKSPAFQASGGNDNATIIGTNANGFEILISTETSFKFYNYFDASYTSYVHVTVPTMLPDTWYHVRAQKLADGTERFFLNDVQYYTASKAVVTSDYRMSIGSTATNNLTDFFVDDVRVITGSVSDAEFTKIYNNKRNTPKYTCTIPTQGTAPTSAKVLDRSVTPTVASDTFDGTDTFTRTYNKVTKTARDIEYGFVADDNVEIVQLNINQNMEP